MATRGRRSKEGVREIREAGYRPEAIVGFDMGARGHYLAMVHKAANGQPSELPFAQVGKAMKTIISNEGFGPAASAR